MVSKFFKKEWVVKEELARYLRVSRASIERVLRDNKWIRRKKVFLSRRVLFVYALDFERYIQQFNERDINEYPQQKFSENV